MTLKILHLEHNPDDVKLVEITLKKGNLLFQNLVVDTKFAFENALREFAPDLVISEYILPSIRATEAIHIIKKQGLKTPFILVAKTLTEEAAEIIMEAGANDFIFKDRLFRLPYAVKNAIEKYNTEQKIGESESLNRVVLSSLSLHIALIDEKGKILYVQESHNADTIKKGLTSLKINAKGSNYFDFCKDLVESGDENSLAVLTGIQSVFKKEKPYFEMEYSFNSSEQVRWFLFRVNFFGNTTNQVIISHQDITDRKCNENSTKNTSVELQQALFELKKILDTSLDVICTVNAEGEFVNVSAASKQVWGYTPEELIGTKFINLVFHEDKEVTSKAAENFFNGIQQPLFENRYIHKNGKIVTILWSVNWDEKLKLMYCIAKDITETKKLDNAIKNQRDQFYDMFLKTPSAIGMLKGAKHVFEMANPLYLELMGKSDIVGKTIVEVFPEGIEQGVLSMLDHVFNTGESYFGNEMLVKVDVAASGKLTDFYMNFVYQPYRDGNGNIEGVFFFINDVTEQVLSRKELEKSEKFFKGVIENSDDLITIIDASGQAIYTSPAVSKKFGYTTDELLKMNTLDVMHPDDIPIAAAFIAEVVKHPGVTMTCPLIRERKKDGSLMWIEGTLTNFLETDGINAIVANFRDVTERKQADEENKFKANLLNTIGQAAIATDLNGIVNYWNQAAEHIYGWTKEEALGQNIRSLTTSDTTVQQANQIMEALKKGELWSGEFRAQKKDNSTVPVLVTNSPIYNNQNILTGIIGISSDITESKKAEEKLIRSEIKLKAAQRIARVGSWEIDLRTDEHTWSEEYYRILGIHKEVKPSRSVFMSYVHPDDRLMTENILENAFSISKDDSFEFRFIKKNGNIGYATSKWKFEFNEHGNPLYVYGILKDLTNEKKIEIERTKMISDIIQRNSDLEQFSYIVSHNLRAPAANIIGFADILRDETITPLEQKELLKGLLTSVKGLDSIIRDINTVLQSKLEVHEKKEVIIFSELLEDVILGMNNLVHKHHVKIISDFSAVEEIYSLKVYIYSIFYNLISNGIKYSKPNEIPLIEINSQKEKAKIILTFKDNGLGIDMKTNGDKVFGLYNRFHSHVEGKGMGLFMVKTQVELLGGKITFKSEINEGTEFLIEFEN
ncbi:MAG: PAS domain S-box protein [Cellulophaga sp.]|nr:PAS domain S-box protein [Cellulophaga sp.]